MRRAQLALLKHQTLLARCRRCPRMQSLPIVGNPVHSKVLLVGQAPGIREGELKKPFAWTAGKMLFKWFGLLGVDEEMFRGGVYMAAVCRCFPGKKMRGGGDRVPDPDEIENCSSWLESEITINRPELVLAVGKLAIGQFMPIDKLDAVVGKVHRASRCGVSFDVIPLPHPSGASTWQHVEPGKRLLREALELLACHPAWRATFEDARPVRQPGTQT